MTTTTGKWLVHKAACSCHPGKWAATLPSNEYAMFDVFELALAYATNPGFRARWKAGQDLAHQYRTGSEIPVEQLWAAS